MVRVVAACDLELGAVHRPESERDHVAVVCGVGGLTHSGACVEPVLTAVFHPVLGVTI